MVSFHKIAVAAVIGLASLAMAAPRQQTLAVAETPDELIADLNATRKETSAIKPFCKDIDKWSLIEFPRKEGPCWEVYVRQYALATKVKELAGSARFMSKDIPKDKVEDIVFNFKYLTYAYEAYLLALASSAEQFINFSLAEQVAVLLKQGMEKAYDALNDLAYDLSDLIPSQNKIIQEQREAVLKQVQATMEAWSNLRSLVQHEQALGPMSHESQTRIIISVV